MPDAVEELATLGGREFIGEVKSRLRNDARWQVMLSPALIDRTRWALGRIISSIDEQIERVTLSGTAEESWLMSINALRRYAKLRYDTMPSDTPIQAMSTTKEARAWRAFSARLAHILDGYDPTALDDLKTPYGGLSAREWLAAREEKQK